MKFALKNSVFRSLGAAWLLLSTATFSLAQAPRWEIEGRFFHYVENSRPKIALVLSGGGSRGISQIGVLEELEKANIPIDMIIGTSMGSIIGGLYASGYSATELDSIATSQNWDQLLALSDAVSRSDLFLQQKQTEEQSFLVIRLNGLTPVLPSALASGQRLTTLLTRLVLNAPYRAVRTFDDLKFPFRSVATDMVTGKRVIISSGDLAQAMRASSTLPVVFTPIMTDTLELVDGGLVSNIPVDIARSMGADIIIAVNTTSPLRSVANIETPWDALDQSTSIMMQLSTKLELEGADIVITPDLEGHLASDFSDLDSLIYEGNKAAERQIANIDSMLLHLRSDSNSTGRRPTYLTVHSQTDEFQIPRNPYRSNSLLLISGLEFSGNRKLEDSILAGPFNELLGHFVRPEQIDHACERLIWLYRKADFGMARLTDVRYDSAKAILNLEIDEGELSDISLRGNKVARSFLIKREFPLDPSEIFTTTKAVDGIDNIYSTGLFSQVLLSTDYAPSPNLTIDVSEKSSRLIRLGIRVDNERNAQLYTSLSDVDLFGTGTQVGLSFSGGLRNRMAEATIGTTRILNTALTYDLRAFTGFRDLYTYNDQLSSSNSSVWDMEINGEYRVIRYGFQLSIGTLLEKFGMVSGALDYGWDRIRSLQDFQGSYSDRIVDLKVASNVDTRDNASFPTSGILSYVYFETSVKNLNTQDPYTKILFNYLTYHSLFSDVTFGQHYEFGFGDASLPLTRQFELGGLDQFYGLREDALFGRQILVANFELRFRSPFKLFFDTYLSGRFDIGDVWNEQQNIILRTLKQGIGGSLEFDTPIGPIDLGAGKAFSPGKSTKLQTISTPWNFYFRVGVEIPTIATYR